MDTDTTTRDRDIRERLAALANVLGGAEADICREAVGFINALSKQVYGRTYNEIIFGLTHEEQMRLSQNIWSI